MILTETTVFTRFAWDRNLPELVDMNAGELVLNLCATDQGVPTTCRNGDKGTLTLKVCQRDTRLPFPDTKPCEGGGVLKLAPPFQLPLNDHQHTDCKEEFALATWNDPVSPIYSREEVQILDKTDSVCQPPHAAPNDPQVSVRLTLTYRDGSGNMVQTSSELQGPSLKKLIPATPAAPSPLKNFASVQ